ncbi:MAG: glycine--tRNA ligase subunit beta, partial [Anaerolineae bacterium]|nr:glycine--tRNA ligase subunit beta [Anaerolineae bacterium]
PYDEIVVTATPRRQVLYVKGLAGKQSEAEQVIKGPPARVAYDESGRRPGRPRGSPAARVCRWRACRSVRRTAASMSSPSRWSRGSRPSPCSVICYLT